jgi:hypothetical protein
MYKLKRLFDLVRYDIPRFFKNIYVFRRTLWNSYNFDYSGILYAIRDQLTNMEDPIRNGHHLYALRTAKQIKTCRLLIDRILGFDEQYLFDHYDIDFSSNRSCKITKIPKYSQAPRESNLQRKILVGKEQQDWDLLFKILHKHGRDFWD